MDYYIGPCFPLAARSEAPSPTARGDYHRARFARRAVAWLVIGSGCVTIVNCNELAKFSNGAYAAA